MDFNRRHVLQGLGASGLLCAAPALATGGRPKNLILVVAKGGWDTTYCLDPKPDSPFVDGPERDDPSNEVVRTVNGIPFWSNPYARPHVDRFFEKWGHRTSVVNGIWVGSIVHDACLNAVLCGSRLGGRPDLTVIHGHEHGRDLPIGNLDLSGISRPGSLGHETVRVGFRHQLSMLLDSEEEFRSPYPDRYRPTPGDQDRVAAHLARRLEAYGAERSGQSGDRVHIDVLGESQDRAQRLRDAKDVLGPALTLGSIPNTQQNFRLATDALSSGLTRAVLCEDQQVGWDSHPSNAKQHEMWNTLLDRLANLCQMLTDEALFEDTVVVVTSEMSRTPLLNVNGGKDHWPYTSAMILGGGLPGGRVLGGTDDRTLGLTVDLETGALDPSGQACGVDNVSAGLLEMLDIDPAEWLPNTPPYRALQG